MDDSELFPDIPKPLIPIENIPVLEREICSLRNQGFTDIILTVSHMADKIISYFGDGENDIKAGIAAGCKTVLINGEGNDHQEG